MAEENGIAARVDRMTQQLEDITDCDILLEVIDEFVDEVFGILTDTIQEQLQILKDELPLLDLPTSITQIIGYIKKLVLGRIFPRLKAFIKLLKKIAETAAALNRLLQAIQSIPDKIDNCLEAAQADLISSIEGKVQGAIDAVTAPVDDALNEINQVQNAIENIIENPLNERIVTDSLDTFLATVDAAEAAIGGQVETALNDPLPTPNTFTGSADVANTESLEMSDGLIIGVTEANTA